MLDAIIILLLIWIILDDGRQSKNNEVVKESGNEDFLKGWLHFDGVSIPAIHVSYLAKTEDNKVRIYSHDPKCPVINTDTDWDKVESFFP